MNSQSDQIRALLEEVDELLHGGSNSFLWRFSGDRARHRQTLENLQSYLTKLQYALKARATQENDLPILLRSNSPNPFAIDDYEEEGLEAGSLAPTEAVVQGDTTELEVRPFGYQDSEGLLDQLGLELAQLRESLLGPLQQEVEQLRQERSALQEEVTQLKIERAENGPFREDLLHQFLETLVGRLQERMVKQVSQILQEALPQIIASQTAALPPAEVAEIQQLQQRANGLLSNMDSTLRVFSQTLEQNIGAYQQSLSVGLERMHSMGREGEVMMSSLVNRLAEQMEQQTELYLKPASAAPVSAASVSAAPQMAVSSRGIVGQGIVNRESQAVADEYYQSREVTPSTPSSAGKSTITVPDELDAFYADLVGSPATTIADKTNPEEVAADKAVQPFNSLEDALFDGIPEGESAWATTWYEGEAGETQASSPSLASDELTPEAHIIHSLTDLVGRTFNDLEGLNLPENPDASPSLGRQSTQTAVLELKKKRTQPRRIANPFQEASKRTKAGDCHATSSRKNRPTQQPLTA